MNKVKKLYKPNLEELQYALTNGLKSNFAEVSVDVVDCPDLTKEPFGLKSKGLGGSTAVVDVGGPPYLLPNVFRDKLYDFRDVAKTVNLNPCFIVGAGAGPWPYANTNCEMIANVVVQDGKVDSGTVISKISKDTGKMEVEFISKDESRFALLANFFVSEGKESKVLKVNCKKRKGNLDFVTAMRTSLANHFYDKYIGMGGLFVVKKGKVRQHVMQDFSEKPLNTEKDLNEWLRFFEMSAPLIALGAFLSQDVPDFDLRVQHFHSFSHHNEAGHYHYDTTPDDIEYEAYLNVADTLHRIDQPLVTHKFGRD
ncbi:ester hydrolase C11orf54 homolog [Cimex lectularius]|uniref:DUF1907 domain-containing protein n=1 Tax=Cimex lectularius TaxID=79782 RepID=A0A8I6RB80_CIMLE|nr:ester hydrolase C11orf54 homolog [Cimex lectularius]XP_014240639.1 ester hydrolase C11orf54 homolog [Cimex lectularius]